MSASNAPFPPFPSGNALAHGAIQFTKVLLYYAEIGKQATSRIGHLQESIFHLGCIQQRDSPFPDLLNIGIDLSLSLFQFGHARGRVHFGSLGHFPQQSEDGFQPRLGTYELALA
jgi:hypothetical protein